MSLSAGTLNLKFMQRAAARSSNSTSKSANSTTTTTSTTTIKPISTKEDTTTIDAEPTTVASTSEDGLRWSLPARSIWSTTVSKLNEDQLEGRRVRFESSYLPFLDGPSAIASGSGSGSSSRGGGGRIAFGGFGEEEKEEKEKGEKAKGDEADEGEDEDEAQREIVEASQRRRCEHEPDVKKRRGRDADEERRPKMLRRSSWSISPPPALPKTFLRPAGFSSPPHTHQSGPRTTRPGQTPNAARDMKPETESELQTEPPRKMSTADRLRQIATSRNSPKPVPPIPKDGLESKPEISTAPVPPTKSVPPPIPAPPLKKNGISITDAKAGRNLDEREVEQKAQRKKEKKARKRARKAAARTGGEVEAGESAEDV